MHNLLILDDASTSFIQEPFLSEFVKSYWSKIALVIPVTQDENFFEYSHSDVINRGHTIDWLFAIVSNPHHPLDVDWILLKPRQAHPWWYGNHPATDNFNRGGSTSCFAETLYLIETLSKSDRVQESCCNVPELYSENPPKTFEFLYRYKLFRNAKILAASDHPSFDDLYDSDNVDDNINKIHNSLCLGLYGCNDATLNMQWQVVSMTSNSLWTLTTLELADKVTLAMRLSGKSDHYIDVSPSEAFEQWMGSNTNNEREPLFIRTKEDILFSKPQVSNKYCSDAYFLDCENQLIKRLGLNGGNPLSVLQTWGIDENDERVQFLLCN
jgi:hypothetical protein